jgi:hypothetical protein
MTTYRCRKCPATGMPPKPVYHPGLWACPKEGAFDAGKVTRAAEKRAAAKKAMETPAPGGAPMPGASSPAPGILQPIELGTKIAETARRDAAQPQADSDWLLPADSSETFFGTIRNGVRMVANWVDDLFAAEKTPEGKIKDSVFEMNAHDIAASRGGFGQRFATKIVKGLGAKTLAEGIATVDTLAFGVMFGAMFLNVIGHFIRMIPDSPRAKKWKESAAQAKTKKEEAARLAKENKALTEAQKAGAVTTTGKAVGSPG